MPEHIRQLKARFENADGRLPELGKGLLAIADWLDQNNGPMMGPETVRESAEAMIDLSEALNEVISERNEAYAKLATKGTRNNG